LLPIARNGEHGGRSVLQILHGLESLAGASRQLRPQITAAASPRTGSTAIKNLCNVRESVDQKESKCKAKLAQAVPRDRNSNVNWKHRGRGRLGRGGPVGRFLRLIRFSHTIFALPFALGALIVAANGWPSARILLLVLLCMVFARTAAMLFNRMVDWSLDQRNPRTASRHLLVPKSVALLLLILSSAAFVASAAAINRLTFLLAPVALSIIFFYSITKRFTSATHLFLGLALAVAPIGAWIAQTGHVDPAPVVLALGVICWVAGFDLIYATQDYDFDRREGIRSLVVKLGIARSLRLAQLFHLVTFGALIGFGVVAKLGAIYYWSVPIIGAALIYEHKTATKLDLAGINRAFFQSNAFVSGVFLVAVCVDRLL
jgi:4-hydroxybenzoate polyprenyltransferase